MSVAPDVQQLPPPPPALLANASLFLDFDGTLVDLAAEPDAICVDPPLLALLADLAEALGPRLAIISGRSIAQLDALLGPIAQSITLSGSHGSEHRWQGLEAHPARPDSLDAVEKGFRAAAAPRDGVIVEVKSFGVALHYRANPVFEPEAQALAHKLAEEHGLAVQDGKMMVELRVPGSDKGVAVARLMRQAARADTRALFVGDDVTDERGFAVVRDLGGAGILVGPWRETRAEYQLEDPAAVRAWLRAGLRAGLGEMCQ